MEVAESEYEVSLSIRAFSEPGEPFFDSLNIYYFFYLLLIATHWIKTRLYQFNLLLDTPLSCNLKILVDIMMLMFCFIFLSGHSNYILMHNTGNNGFVTWLRRGRRSIFWPMKMLKLLFNNLTSRMFSGTLSVL